MFFPVIVSFVFLFYCSFLYRKQRRIELNHSVFESTVIKLFMDKSEIDRSIINSINILAEGIGIDRSQYNSPPTGQLSPADDMFFQGYESPKSGPMTLEDLFGSDKD